MTDRVRTERGIERLINFSDATVAIAITLLVLPLVDLASDLDADTSLAELFAENWGSLLSFIITFAVIARLWMVHHRVFEWVADYSAALVWLNMLWLASIVTLPFAANALAFGEQDDAGVMVFYAGTIAVTTLAMMAMLVLMRRDDSLVREDMRGDIDLVTSLSVLVILLVVVVLSLAIPSLGPLILLLLVLAGPVDAVLSRAFPSLARRAR